MPGRLLVAAHPLAMLGNALPKFEGLVQFKDWVAYLTSVIGSPAGYFFGYKHGQWGGGDIV